jgi:hypothetical protein
MLVLVGITGRTTVEESYRCYTQEAARLSNRNDQPTANIVKVPPFDYVFDHQTQTGKMTVFYFERQRVISWPFMFTNNHLVGSNAHLSFELRPEEVNQNGRILTLDQRRVSISESSPIWMGMTSPNVGTRLLPQEQQVQNPRGAIEIKQGVWSGVIQFEPPQFKIGEPFYFAGANMQISFTCKPHAVARKDFVHCAGQVERNCYDKYWKIPDESDSSKIVWCPPTVFESAHWCRRRLLSPYEYVRPNAPSY